MSNNIDETMCGVEHTGETGVRWVCVWPAGHGTSGHYFVNKNAGVDGVDLAHRVNERLNEWENR